MLFVTAHQPSVVDTNAMCALPPALYKPHHYSKNVAVGGCDEATINAFGSRAALDALRGYLGYGVRIINDEGTLCWWGFIENVTVAPETGSAEIACKGWEHKLKNRYYAQSAGMDAYMDGAGAKHNVSEGSGITKIAQSFANTTGTSWTARKLALNLYVVGSRVDNVNVDIVADNAGSPSSTVIASWAISPSGGAVAAANGTMIYDLTTPFTYDNTLRWIVITPTGASSGGNFYQAGVNDKADYANGTFKWFISPNWTANRADNGKATDMQFKLLGAETLDVLLTALYNATVANDYFTGIDFSGSPFASTCQYRDGKERADKVLDALLKIGNTANQRMLFAVSEQRRVRVFTEPLVPAAPYALIGAVKIGQDLAKIANEVRAIYTTQAGASTSGTPATTAWSTDATSVTRYGKRQLTLSLNNVDAAAAASAVATTLSQRAYPITQFDFSGSAAGIDIFGPGGGRIRRDTCPIGYWARLSSANVGSFDSPFTRGANLCFIDGAEYNAEQDDYMPIPKGQVDPLKSRGIEYSEV